MDIVPIHIFKLSIDRYTEKTIFTRGIAMTFLKSQVNSFAKTNPKIWIFGSASGEMYNDNSRHFFEHIQKKQNIKAVWLTKNTEVINYLRERGSICYHFYSPQGIYYALISSVNVISYGYEDLPFFAYIFGRGKIIVQLWHGIPIKKIDRLRKTFLNRILRKILIMYLGRQFDIFVTTTQKVTKIFEEAFGLEQKVFLEAGYPRMEYMISNKEKEEKLMSERFGGKTVFFFLPTFREFDNTFQLYFGNEKKLRELDEFLGKKEYIMLVKLHLRNRNEMHMETFRELKNIIAIDCSVTYDLYSELAGADVLVTDFSGVAYEFAMLGKPIIFVEFREDKYLSKERDVYFLPREVCGGNYAQSWNEFMILIQEKNWKNLDFRDFCTKYIGTKFDGSCDCIERAISNKIL